MGNAQKELNELEVIEDSRVAVVAPFDSLWEPLPEQGLRLKRLLDLVGALFLLLVSAPFMALVAILVKLDSPGPAIYRALRVGKNGRLFICYKFRTMVMGADSLKKNLLHLNERGGLLFKISNDPRVTPLGRFLRKYSVDELPQFFNVILGEMSLVGPRPPLLEEYEKYSAEQKRRMLVEPGLTGLWQIRGRKDPSFENYMALDLQYIDTRNLWLDVRILLKTIPAVFRGTGQ